MALLPLANISWSDNPTKCDLSTLWTRSYWSLLVAISGASAVSLAGAWLAAKCEKRRSRSKQQVVGRARTDTMAILPHRPSTHKTLIIRTISPTAIDVSACKANRLNFAVVACLLAPCLVATWPDWSSASKNQWVAVHMSVVLAGCFSPILHLLCDEMVSSLGLDILKSAETALGGSSSGPSTDAAKRFYTEDDPPDTAM